MREFSLRSLAFFLYLTDALLIILFIAFISGVLVNPILFRLFDLDGESTLAAWFSSSQLFVAACIFGAAAYIRTNDSIGLTFYALWALAFFFLSADEAVGIHEKVTLLFRGVEFLPRFSGNHGIWIPIYFIVGAIFIAVIAKPALRLRRSGNSGITILFVGLAMFVFGAVVIEIISYGELRNPANRMMYLYQVTLEEAFELLGISTMLIGAIKTCFGN